MRVAEFIRQGVAFDKQGEPASRRILPSDHPDISTSHFGGQVAGSEKENHQVIGQDLHHPQTPLIVLLHGRISVGLDDPHCLQGEGQDQSAIFTVYRDDRDEGPAALNTIRSEASKSNQIIALLQLLGLAVWTLPIQNLVLQPGVNQLRVRVLFGCHLDYLLTGSALAGSVGGKQHGAGQGQPGISRRPDVSILAF
ncbi:MAG TPA: hypothetical protein VN688_00960 [Gemmataceae bacterium]|nr:hypothetical protein [Gemmataceae bacterium]